MRRTIGIAVTAIGATIILLAAAGHPLSPSQTSIVAGVTLGYTGALLIEREP